MKQKRNHFHKLEQLSIKKIKSSKIIKNLTSEKVSVEKRHLFWKIKLFDYYYFHSSKVFLLNNPIKTINILEKGKVLKFT